MATSLLNLANNLAEGIHKTKFNYGHDNKTCETCGTNYKYFECCQDDLIECKCLCCNKNYQRNFDENLKKRFVTTSKFSNRDSNKFILLLQEGVYTNQYMDDWENSLQLHYLKKKNFTDTLTWKILQMQIALTQKEFVKILK